MTRAHHKLYLKITAVVVGLFGPVFFEPCPERPSPRVSRWTF